MGAHSPRCGPDELASLVIARRWRRRASRPPRSKRCTWAAPIKRRGQSQRRPHGGAVGRFPVEVAAVTSTACALRGCRPSMPPPRHPRGEGEVFGRGGVESMSRAPYAVPRPSRATLGETRRCGHDPRLAVSPPARIAETFGIDAMGETAENLAELHPEITRQQQDAFAVKATGAPSRPSTAVRFGRGDRPGEHPSAQGDPSSLRRTNGRAGYHAGRTCPAQTRLPPLVAA